MTKFVSKLWTILLIAFITGCKAGVLEITSLASENYTKMVNITGTVSSPINGFSALSFESSMMTGVTDNTITCMPIGSVNTVLGSAVIDSNNSFNLDIPLQPGEAFGCFLHRSAVASGPVPLVFERASSMMSYSAQTSVQSFLPNLDTTQISLGEISITSATVGTGGGSNFVYSAIPVNGVWQNGTQVFSNAFVDMSGEWQIAKSYEDSTKGLLHWCDIEYDDHESSAYHACKANIGNQRLFLHTYRATSGASETRWGIGIWESETAFDSCGKSEKLYLNYLYTVDPTSYASSTISLPFLLSLNLSNLDSAALSKAPFNRWAAESADASGYTPTNCPYGDKNYPGCASAKTCGDLNYASDYTHYNTGGTAVSHTPSAIEQGRAKVYCVLNAMEAGGASAYDWGNSCAFRLSADWNTVNEIVSSAVMTVNGCDTPRCTQVTESNGYTYYSGGFYDYHFRGPQNRKLSGELVVNGVMGSATVTEMDYQIIYVKNETQSPPATNPINCYMNRSQKLTVIQKTDTQATLQVDFLVTPSSTNFMPACMEEEWIRDEINAGVRTIKLDLIKK